MAKITDEMIAECYKSGVLISDGETTAHREKDRIVCNTGMNQTSAFYYLNAVDALLSNGEIERDINKTAVDDYLGNIKKDFGKEALIIAAGVCLRRYEETRRLGDTRYYYKRLAEKHLLKLEEDERNE